jgi:hypothetical protein
MKTHVQVSATAAAVFLLTACNGSGTGSHSGEAARPLTFKQREAITAAMPAWLRRYPIGCVWLDMSVSKNGRYAKVAPGFLNATRPPCLKYASNGYWLLERQRKWRIMYNGSTDPPCSLRVPREFAPCLR